MAQEPGNARGNIPDGDSEQLSLAEQGQSLREECRMVLPGIQALFGFQLVAVFSNGFAERLSRTNQALHLFATLLVAVAAGLVMTPAAYHRQTHPHAITKHFLRLSSRLLLWSMVPLGLGVCLDFYLIGGVILGATAGLVLSVVLALVLVSLWVVLPARHR